MEKNYYVRDVMGGIIIMKKKLPILSPREKDVLSVLWASEKSLTATEIVEQSDKKLSINTVQAILRNLLKKKYIEVAEVVYNHTSLARSYKYIVSAEQCIAEELNEIRSNTFGFSMMNFIDFFLNSDDDEIEVLNQLEKIIQMKKKSK